MHSSEIISNINQIYNQFRIPPNLRLHMFRVASVAQSICDNWTGPKLNQEDIISVCLMHDLGNIVKYDFNQSIHLMGEESKRIEYWKQVQQDVISKYGKGEYEVTFNMAEELGINDRLKFLLNNYKFIQNSGVVESTDFDLKISNYGDYRVGPFGILSVKQRMDDFVKRYAHLGACLDNPKIVSAIQNMFALEKQIFDNASIRPEDINDESVGKYLEIFTNL